MRTHTLDHANRQQAREHQKTKHQQRHRSARRHHQTTINPQRRYRTIRHEQQQRRHHAKIRIPTTIKKRIIPIHRTHTIGKQLLTSRHIIRIIRIAQRVGHIQIKPRMTIKQRPSHMIILIVIIRIHAIRMKTQRHRRHQLPRHHRNSHQPRNRQQHAQRHTLTHTRRIQRHLPQARARTPQRHQHQHQHQQRHTQRTHRKRHTHIRANRIKRNQRPLRLHHLHAHRTTGRSPHIQRMRRIQRHRTQRTSHTIRIRTNTHRTQHARTGRHTTHNLIGHRHDPHILRRTIRSHLQIRLRRISNLQQPVITTLKPRPQRVIRSRRITRRRQRAEKRHITQHALNQHHHNKSGYNSCAHTMTRLKTLFRKSHELYSKGCMSH